ncbi:claudin-4-like [Clarias gariepinus]
MASQGMHLLGSGFALLGWLGVLLACLMPMWRVTSFMGTTIITSEITWEGIWTACVVQSTGQMQCDPYDSMMALSSELKAAQVLIVGSLLTGSLGLILALIGGKCTSFPDNSSGAVKNRVVIVAGLVLMISGLLCMISATWVAAVVIQMFSNPQIPVAQRREIGPAIYVAWAGSVLLLLSGIMLCATSCSKKTEDDSPSVDYRVVRSSGTVSTIRSSQQVRVSSQSQNRKILSKSFSSDSAPLNQHDKLSSEGSKKSKISVIDSEQSDGPSTKSQLNHTNSNNSLRSSNSEAISTSPMKTYI